MDAATKKLSLNDKLNLIIDTQKKILKNEEKILGEEAEIKQLEKEELKHEESEESSLEKLMKLELQLKRNISSPIKKVTKRDMFKGMIGASVGIMGHFAFTKGADIATTLTVFRSTILYLVAFIVIVIMLYYTGFKDVQKNIVAKFMPLRALVLYSVSVVVIIVINLLFGKIDFSTDFVTVYNLVGASIILAVMGAGTADLIGKNE